MLYTVTINEETNETKNLMSLIRNISRENKNVVIQSGIETCEDPQLADMIMEGMKGENVSREMIFNELEK